MDRAQIQAEWDKFIEYPSDDKRIVTTTSALLFAEHIAKLQATQEPAQAGELPDEREAFETHARSNGWRDEDFRPSSNTQHGYTYRYASTEQCWQFWRARAALSARKPLSRDQVKALKDEYGYSCAPVQAQADFINGIRCGEKAHDIGLEVKT